MADWYDTIVKGRAKKLINNAQQQGLDFVSFMKEATKTGVSNDPDVLNYAKLLKEDQTRARESGKQEQVTSAVARAMQPQPAVDTNQLMQRANMATSMPPEEYAKSIQGQPSVTETAIPQTQEQFLGVLGRQPLPSDVGMSDVKENPQFQFAQGALTSEADELARARLKVQQDAEERKRQQINKQRDQADLRLRLQDRELAWKYYNAGVNAMKPEFLSADKWDQMAEGASVDAGKAEADLDMWKTISREIDKEGSEYFGQYSPEEVNAQIAKAETIARNAKIDKDRWAKMATEIRTGAYERGGNISKASKKTFQQPKPPAPTPGDTLSKTIDLRKEFNY